jgi:hypothetical protein
MYWGLVCGRLQIMKEIGCVGHSKLWVQYGEVTSIEGSVRMRKHMVIIYFKVLLRTTSVI